MACDKIVICFDCGGIFANDIPGDMFSKLAKDNYEGDQAVKVNMSHANNKDLWGRFKLEPGFTETMYWQEMIKRQELKEDVDELKRRLRESVVCYQHVREVAVQLYKMGYMIAIMSNHSTEWFDFITTTCKFEEFCPKSRTIVSQTVQAAKPGHEIMERLTEALMQERPQFVHSDLIFIDDTKANVDSSIAFGFNSFVYDARKQSAEELWTELEKFGIQRSLIPL